MNHFISNFIRSVSYPTLKGGIFHETFDGKIIYYATVDSQFELDGILMENVEDYKFSDLPYVEDEDVEIEESLINFLKSGEEKHY